MNLKALKVLFFYLFLAFLIVIAPSLVPFLDPALIIAGVYFLMIMASLLFIWQGGIQLKQGSLLRGLIISSASMGLLVIVMLASGLASPSIDNPDIMTPLLLGFVLQALVATAEELSFRGYIYSQLEYMGFLPAALSSSVGFAVLHLPAMYVLGVDLITGSIAFMTIVAGGLLFALLYVKSGILTAIGFHFGWNFIQYHVFGFGYAGAEPIIDISLSGPALLTGGVFGPEASAIGLTVMAGTVAAAWYFYKKKENIES